jgi:BirA family biotin operon repressor/biotin-[acetyl-CoA-carboxylase] ligase
VNLLVSVLLRPPPVPERPHLATVAAGVARVDALRARTGVDARLKWPNDVVVPGGPGAGKLAGILAESRVRGADVTAVVVGVGCNLGWPAGVGDPGVPPGATSVVAAGGRAVARDDLLESWLAAFLTRLDGLAAPGGPAELRDAWIGRADTIGREVRVLTAGGELVGSADGVTEDGALVLGTATGRVEVTVGDVEHLRPV